MKQEIKSQVDEEQNIGNESVDRKTEQGFTPGPWGDWRREDGSLFIGTRDHVYVCQMVGAERDPEVEANARLIAAAPALYEALTTLLKTETNLGGVSAITLLDAVDKARAALALVDRPADESAKRPISDHPAEGQAS